MRKTPVTHRVHSYVRDGQVVRSYTRGKGWLSSEKTHTRRSIDSYLEPSKKRWEQIADGPDYRWESKQNPKITVNVNKEEMEDEYSESGKSDVYLVFPSYNHRGIPNTPELFSEGTSGSFEEARKDAIDLARKIMKLPVEKVESFNWNMVE